MPIELIFRGLLKSHPLGELENVDGRTLARDLQSPPTLPGRALASNIDTALGNSARSGGTSVVVVIDDRKELEAIHETCGHSLDMRRVPSLKELCAQVARTLAS
jgi:hypothetical protein